MKKGRPFALSPDERRFDFGSWVAGHLTVLTQGSDEWIVECPRCSRVKLALNVRRKCWQCWVCGFAGWRPTALVAYVLGVHPARAAEIVAGLAIGGRALVDVGELLPQAVEKIEGPAPIAPDPPGILWGHLDGRARAYAQERGIPAEHAHLFGLSACRGDNRRTRTGTLLAGRLVFPVWDDKGRLVFWTSRATRESKIKIVSMPAACKVEGHADDCTCLHEEWGLSPTPGCAGKADVLVGYHLIKPGEPVVVVEGPVDAAVCGPQFVATQGAGLSWRQALLLATSGASEVIFLFDPDVAGVKAVRAAYALLSPLIPCRVAECPVGMDPAILGRAEAWSLAQIAPSAPPIARLYDNQGQTRHLSPQEWKVGPLLPR